MDFFNGIIEFLTSLFAALSEFLGDNSTSGEGSNTIKDFLAAVRDYVGAGDAE